MQTHHYALILAGGSGTRFWPLSRHRRPKQLLRLFDDETLIEKTVQRLEGVVPRQNILILTNQEQLDGLREAVAHLLPAENVYSEPAKQDTAPAVALGLALIARRDPNAVMAVLPADHLIADPDAFARTLRNAFDVAEKTPFLVTIGIEPTWPCEGYGYIERGPQLDQELPEDGAVYRVTSFKEKPDAETAQKYLDLGNYAWNAGMFIWSVPVVRAELTTHCPELAEFVTNAVAAPDLLPFVDAKFQELPKISIDYALMEKAKRVYNLDARFPWDDVGGWHSVGAYLASDEAGNQVKGDFSALDAGNNLVFSATTQRIALLGVNDLIVVQTEDALLVAHRSQADQIKELVKRIPPEFH